MNENETKNQLAVFDSLLDQLTSLASDSQIQPSRFFEDLTKFAVTVLDPEHFAVLAAGPKDALLPICGEVVEVQHRVGWSQCDPANPDVEARRLESKDSGTQVVSIETNSTTWGWIVVSFDPPKVSPFQKEILASLTEIVSTFVAVRRMEDQQRWLDSWQRFSTNVHSSLNFRQVANHIANDGRLLMNCERVSVFSISRQRARLLAVSSVSRIENRSALLKLQNALVNSAIKYGQPLGSDRLPSETALRNRLTEYQTQSGFPFLFGISLETAGRQIGYLLAEGLADINRIEFVRGCQAVVPSAAIALGNARRFESVPLHNFFGTIGTAVDHLRLTRLTVILALVASVVAFLIVFQTDFKVRISGELRPVVDRSVFAPHDGIVDEVFVRHGMVIGEGDAVVNLRSPELDLQLARNQGESLRLEKLLDAKNIALNQASSDPNASPALIGQLSSEISDVEYQLKTLNDEHKFLESQQSQLHVSSPIQGTVITWRADEQLTNKPLRWGDAIISIAQEEGDWELRFRVPERRMGYLLAARQQGKGNDLEFFFESRPEAKFHTSIASIAKSTEPDPEMGPVTLVVCGTPEGDFALRHGARVIADVDCGKASIGYVWTHELIDSFRADLSGEKDEYVLAAKLNQIGYLELAACR